MTNQNVFWIAGLVFAGVLVDVAVNNGAASLFLVLKLFDLVEFLMVWR